MFAILGKTPGIDATAKAAMGRCMPLSAARPESLPLFSSAAKMPRMTKIKSSTRPSRYRQFETYQLSTYHPTERVCKYDFPVSVFNLPFSYARRKAATASGWN